MASALWYLSLLINQKNYIMLNYSLEGLVYEHYNTFFNFLLTGKY